jgi:hypothetical protein
LWLGDFCAYLAGTTDSYDFVLAVLYHMREPVQLLADIARVAPSFGLWTHYYDREVINGRPKLSKGRAEYIRFTASPSRITMYWPFVIIKHSLLILLISFGLAEVTLRIYDWIQPLPIFYSRDYNRFRGKPFAPDWDFRLNSKGFKDVEFEQHKAAGIFQNSRHW